MNKTLLLPILASMACAPLSSFAQSPAPAAPPALPHPATGFLTPAERQTLMAANRKAQEAPAVKAAAAKRLEALKAFDNAMVAKDKSLAPIVEKLESAAAPAPGAKRPSLTQDEAMQLRTARGSMMGSPEADALKQANLDYRDALQKAMVAANPAVADILAKLPSAVGRGLAGAVKAGAGGGAGSSSSSSSGSSASASASP